MTAGRPDSDDGNRGEATFDGVSPLELKQHLGNTYTGSVLYNNSFTQIFVLMHIKILNYFLHNILTRLAMCSCIVLHDVRK